MRKTAYLALVPLMLLVLFTPVSTETDQNLDVLRFEVIRSPNEALVAMQTERADVLHDLIRTTDVETLEANGFLVTDDPGFHVGFVGYNIRADQSYRRSDPEALAYWPLSDMEFRHALFHCYDQETVFFELYSYIVVPVQSLVPPAQARYHNPAAPTHPYNPGDPFNSTKYNPVTGENEDSCSILRYANYTFVDVDHSGTVTNFDYWKTPVGTPLPRMEIWWPLPEVCCIFPNPYIELNIDLNEIGLGATTANGMHGIFFDGEDFNWFLAQVYDHANFDGYTVFYRLERLPSQLYSLLHSSQDSLAHPGRRNAVGINDPDIDTLTDTVKSSLSLNDIQDAAKAVQEMLATPDKSVYPNADNFALVYMPLYSRNYFNAYNPNLRGVIRSRGYGSDNRWTDLNIHWEPGTERIEDGKIVAIFVLNDYPESFNPLCAEEYYDWDILSRSYDGLLGINPYNHNDLSWLAEDWTITETVSGMEIDFVLNDTVEWQDGKPFTAHDVEFCLEFLRDYQVPDYTETWETLVDVVVIDATHFTISADQPGIDLFYNYAEIAPMLPEHIWNRFGDPTIPANRQAVLDYDPNVAYNVAPGYMPGPHPTPTNILGTGPFVFQFYDNLNHYCDMWRNENYFKTAAEASWQIVKMFHEIGDVNEDGIIDVLDQQEISFAWGYFVGEPNYNPAADIVQAPFVVDIKDLAMHGFNMGRQREYP